ncbi:MAG: hypothetical protein Q7U16_02500 [Agitococcus sp.]|nr:hypothetical protein [Agitococcus sp.]
MNIASIVESFIGENAIVINSLAVNQLAAVNNLSSGNIQSVSQTSSAIQVQAE